VNVAADEHVHDGLPRRRRREGDDDGDGEGQRQEVLDHELLRLRQPRGQRRGAGGGGGVALWRRTRRHFCWLCGAGDGSPRSAIDAAG